jgi:hypothetical protein
MPEGRLSGCPVARFARWSIMSDPYIRLAGLLRKVVEGEMSAEQAISDVSAWTDSVENRLFEESFHALHHFASDAYIRESDEAYAIQQRRTLEGFATALEQHKSEP